MKYTDIENQIISSLESIKTELGVKELSPYNGELAVEDISQEIFRFPAVYLYVEGLSNVKSNTKDIRTYRIHIFILDKQLRNTDNTTSNVYDIIEKIRDILHRARFFSGFSELYLESEKVVGLSRSLAVMEAIYTFKGLI